MYWINPASEDISLPALSEIYHRGLQHLNILHATDAAQHLLSNEQIHKGRQAQWVSLTWRIYSQSYLTVCNSWGQKREKKQLKETRQDKAENRVMEWEHDAGFRWRQTVRSFCSAQPVS